MGVISWTVKYGFGKVEDGQWKIEVVGDKWKVDGSR